MVDVDLVNPTDFEILEVLSDGRRHDAPDLKGHLDKRSKYLNDRLNALRRQGLVRKPGPNPDSTAMYVITPLGEIALELRGDYTKRNSAEWGDRVRAMLAERESGECDGNADVDVGA